MGSFGDFQQGKPKRKNSRAAALASGGTAPEEDAQPTEDRPRRTRAVNRVPAGYDANIWGLAGTFEQIAEERGFELATARPIIYRRLQDRISRSPLRDAPSQLLAEVVDEMMVVFWDDEVLLANTRYALDQFCGVETFTRLAEWALFKRRKVSEPRSYQIGPSEVGQERRRAKRERQEFLLQPDAWEKTMERVKAFVARVEAKTEREASEPGPQHRRARPPYRPDPRLSGRRDGRRVAQDHREPGDIRPE